MRTGYCLEKGVIEWLLKWLGTCECKYFDENFIYNKYKHFYFLD